MSGIPTRFQLALLLAAAALLAGCNREPDPYLRPGDPRGTPADRTGGSSNEPIVSPDGKFIYPPVVARKA